MKLHKICEYFLAILILFVKFGCARRSYHIGIGTPDTIDWTADYCNPTVILEVLKHQRQYN